MLVAVGFDLRFRLRIFDRTARDASRGGAFAVLFALLPCSALQAEEHWNQSADRG